MLPANFQGCFQSYFFGVMVLLRFSDIVLDLLKGYTRFSTASIILRELIGRFGSIILNNLLCTSNFLIDNVVGILSLPHRT